MLTTLTTSASVVAAAIGGGASSAHAQGEPATVAASAASNGAGAAPSSSTAFDFGPLAAERDLRQGLDPLPSRGIYVSYGIALHTESLLSPGAICPSGKSDCVIGNGGGISASGGYRNPNWTLSVTYEVSFLDSSSIYQRGILQNVRGDARWRPWWAVIGDQVALFAGAGAGIAGYGDNWAVSVLGPSVQGALGAEYEAGTKLALVFAFSYRAAYLRALGQTPLQYPEGGGIVQFFGLSLGVELHDPL